MKKRTVMLFAALAIALSGQTPRPTGSISGRVLTKAQKPIPGATVRVVTTDSVGPAITDEEGRFEIAGLPLARHTLRVTAPRYSSGLRGEVDLAEQPNSVIDFSFDSPDVVRESVVVTGSGTQ